MGVNFVILQIIWFTVLLVISFKKNYNLFSKYLILVWFSLSLFSLLYFEIYGMIYSFEITLAPYLFFDACFVMMLIPIVKMDEMAIDRIRIGSPTLLRWFLAIIGIISLPPFVENLIQVFYSYAIDSSNLYDVYASKMTQGFNKNEIVTWLDPVSSIMNSISIRNQYVIPFLSFFYIAKYKPSKGMFACLMIAIINPVLFGVAMAGRGALVFCAMNFVFLMLLFHKQFDPSIMLTLKKFAVIMMVFFGAMLTVLTIMRFRNGVLSTQVGMLGWSSLYLGEGMVNFNDKMWHITALTQGDTSFSFIKDIFGFHTFTDVIERQDYWSESVTGVESFRFYTYIGDVFSDLGAVFTFIFFACLAWIIRKMTSKKNISLLGLYAFTMYYYMMLVGFTILPYKIYYTMSNLFVGLLVVSFFAYVHHKRRVEPCKTEVDASCEERTEY